MKILLLKDVPKVGRKYEVKEVADGFARNSLFPRKLAEPVTSDTEKRIAKMEQDEASRGAVAESLLIKNLAELHGQTITLQEKANEKGHLFAAVREPEIVRAIKKQLNIDIPPEALVLEKPIKETGEHSLTAEGAGKKTQFIVRLI